MGEFEETYLSECAKFGVHDQAWNLSGSPLGFAFQAKRVRDWERRQRLGAKEKKEQSPFACFQLAAVKLAEWNRWSCRVLRLEFCAIP